MENTKGLVITHEMLRAWHPCTEGYRRFCELFPEGADLKTATHGLEADGHGDWGFWLFIQARDDGRFQHEVAAGYQNTGDRNTGHWNTGDRNTGHWNTGDRNTGHWNTGHRNTGYFNTVTPDDILVFNKPCKRADWDAAEKPSFLYFSITEWVPDHRMTDTEKAANPDFYVAEGYLKTIPYQEAFRAAWDAASAEDRALLFKLPNFDAAVFKEISGIDVSGEAR